MVLIKFTPIDTSSGEDLFFNSRFINNQEKINKIMENINHPSLHHYLIQFNYIFKYNCGFNISIVGEFDKSLKFNKQFDITLNYIYNTDPWYGDTFDSSIPGLQNYRF